MFLKAGAAAGSEKWNSCQQSKANTERMLASRTEKPSSPASAPGRGQRNRDVYNAGRAVFQGSNRLLADAEFLNDLFVALGIMLSEVVKQAATLADHHEKAAPGGMVLLMRLEMLRQLTNTLTQDGDLDLGGTGVGVMSAVLVDQGGFFLSC